MTGWGALLAGLASGTVGTGGVGALLLVRSNRRKTDAGTELLHVQAAERAVKMMEATANRLQGELDRANRKVEQLEKRAEMLEEQLLAADAKLLQTNKETEDLRARQSVERQQLMDQMAKERAEHEATIAAMKTELSKARLGRLSNGSGTLLGFEEFGN